MSNKKIFKELYSSKINKDKNYQEILNRIENQKQRIFFWKKTLIPITGVLLIFTLIYINTGEKNSTLNDTSTNYNKDYDIYTSRDETQNNSLTKEIEIKKINTDYEEVEKKYSYLKDLNIPTDLKDNTYQEVYLKDNNILNNYEFIYQNISNNRIIILSFSDEYQPLRISSFNDNEKTYKINNQDIIIYQSEFKYLTIFTHNNINYDIETNNLNEEELINLITSIIK